MNKRFYPVRTLPMVIVSIISAHCFGQLNSPAQVPTAPNSSAPIVQEDFYQPVQEVWSGGVTQTMENRHPLGAQSDFIPLNSSSGTPAPDAPIYSLSQTDSSPAMTETPVNSQQPASEISNAAGPGYAHQGQIFTAPPPASTVNNPASVPQAGANAVQLFAPQVQGPGIAQPIVAGSPNQVVHDYLGAQSGYTSRMFFRYDALLGVLSNAGSAPIGNPDAAGVFTSNGIPFPFLNSLSTDIFGNPTDLGNRFEFGDMGDSGGWMIGIFDWDNSVYADAPGGTMQLSDPIGVLDGYQDGNGDMVDDDLDGDHVHGRNGIDLGTPDPAAPGSFLPIFDGIVDATAPADTDDLVSWVPIFNRLQGTQRTDITSVGVTHAWQKFCGQGRFGFDRRFLGRRPLR